MVGVSITARNDLGLEARPLVTGTASGPTGQDSRGSADEPAAPRALLGALAAAAMAGAALMIAGEFQTLYEVQSGGIVVSSQQAGGHHGFALVVLGFGAILLALVAAGTANRAAAGALGVVGIIGVAVVLAVDLPDATADGTLSGTFAAASAEPRLGLWLGLGGAALVAGAGLGMLGILVQRR